MVVLAEGDPLFYSSCSYLHDRLAERFGCEVVPGVTSISAASVAAATPLVRHEDVLTVLPGTLPVAELARRLADTQAAVIMKLGRTFPAVVEALRLSGRLADARYVERASTGAERVGSVLDVDPGVGALLLGDASSLVRIGVPTPRAAPRPVRPQKRTRSTGHAAGDRSRPRTGPLAHSRSIGRTRRRSTMSSATAPTSTGCRPGPVWSGIRSGNTVELDRARLALDLARSGERVAVVSGGDAGVFGMAAAVFEAADDPAYADVEIEVLPGVTAAQAVAARAGAPLGADYAVLSLSDRLKPWEVIETRLRAAAAADLSLAIYNPASRTRTHQVKQAKEILLEYRAATTPIVVGRAIGRADESMTVTPLADLDPDSVDMSCLLIIGSSQTRIARSGVWTPRSTADPATDRPSR